MLADLRELYQEVILDHGKNPRNFGHPPAANRSAEGYNPFCGDQLQVYLILDDDERIADVAFEGKGCAISVASASMMTEVVKGRAKREAEALFDAFHRMCTEENYDIAAETGLDEDTVEHLQVMAGVREFPVRVKCATLAWHTLTAALAGRESATSEKAGAPS